MLLVMHPAFDVLEVEWQAFGPWLLVTLGQRSDGATETWARYPFAIWEHTGAVHGIRGGAVTDDPIFEP